MATSPVLHRELALGPLIPANQERHDFIELFVLPRPSGPTEVSGHISEQLVAEETLLSACAVREHVDLLDEDAQFHGQMGKSCDRPKFRIESGKQQVVPQLAGGQCSGDALN